MKRFVWSLAFLLSAGAWGDWDDDVCTWSQWGQSAAHDGQTCSRGQDPDHELAHIVYDPFETLEMAEGGGDLFVHYQVPLDDDEGNFYMMHKAGTYLSCDPPGSGVPAGCGIDPANERNQVWTEKRYHFRHDGTVEEKWTFTSDWKPYPVFRWEPMFQPALSGPFIYVPGAGGSVWQVLKILGLPIQRINPFPTVDANTYVSGGVTTDRFGFIYWNVIQQDPDTGFNKGYIVKAAPWGKTTVVATDTLIPGAPAQLDGCFYPFFFLPVAQRPPRPWPPAGVQPPQFLCGAQRPGVNVTPAIGRDGTVYVATRADFAAQYSYVVALDRDLHLKWATSLRGLVNDACFHIVQPSRFACPPGTPDGVDPNTGLPPGLSVDDASSSSPVALPDGGVLYGALDDYNSARGHLVKLDRNGVYQGTYPFGWDTTPAIYRHDGTYSIIEKDNHYFDGDPFGGPFYITQLSADLEIEWQFQNTQHQACVRLPDGTLSCSDASPDGETHEGGFEWCVNAPAVDRDGNLYVNAEDGFVYQIGQGGVLKSQTFLNQALGAAYTPAAIDGRGRIYTLNNGELSVRGN